MKEQRRSTGGSNAKSFLGFHYDVARGSYLKPQYFCDAIRLAAESGYTHFLPYLENMVVLPATEMACPSAAYSAEDWLAFEQVAVESGIELVPHFNAIGHSETFIAAYPDLGGADSSESMELDPSSSQNRDWVKRAIDEFCSISHSKYFLIGGDEWQPPHSLLKDPMFDPAEAWVKHMNSIIEALHAQGRTPIVWHDIPIHYPAALDRLSRKAVIAFWFYDRDSDYPVLDLLKGLGFKTLMATSVFGLEGNRVSARVVDALRCAASASHRYEAEGIIVTSWERVRWEAQKANIPLAAEILRGAQPPHELVEVMSIADAWSKLPREHEVAKAWAYDARKLLQSSSLEPYPELQQITRCLFDGDSATDKKSYELYHAAEGPLYRVLEKSYVHGAWPTYQLSNGVISGEEFLVSVRDSPELGSVLTVRNGPESFDLYPSYGASLQNWQRDGISLIIGEADTFSLDLAPPGGYRSYTKVGGLRPVWALGTHNQPCIIWQYPYNWEILEETDDIIEIGFKRAFPHVVIEWTVRVLRGQSGFQYSLKGMNLLAGASCAFNFNLPLPLSLDGFERMIIGWRDGEESFSTSIISERRSAFWIPSKKELSVSGVGGHTIKIEVDENHTAGFFFDWGPGWCTPDLRGRYSPMESGSELNVAWRFSVAQAG